MISLQQSILNTQAAIDRQFSDVQQSYWECTKELRNDIDALKLEQPILFPAQWEVTKAQRELILAMKMKPSRVPHRKIEPLRKWVATPPHPATSADRLHQLSVILFYFLKYNLHVAGKNETDIPKLENLNLLTPAQQEKNICTIFGISREALRHQKKSFDTSLDEINKQIAHFAQVDAAVLENPEIAVVTYTSSTVKPADLIKDNPKLLQLHQKLLESEKRAAEIYDKKIAELLEISAQLAQIHKNVQATDIEITLACPPTLPLLPQFQSAATEPAALPAPIDWLNANKEELEKLFSKEKPISEEHPKPRCPFEDIRAYLSKNPSFSPERKIALILYFYALARGEKVYLVIANLSGKEKWEEARSYFKNLQIKHDNTKLRTLIGQGYLYTDRGEVQEKKPLDLEQMDAYIKEIGAFREQWALKNDGAPFTWPKNPLIAESRKRKYVEN